MTGSDSGSPCVEVAGLVDRPGPLTPASLARLRPVTVEVEQAPKGRPARCRVFAGVWLIDAIQLAGLRLDRDRPHDRLSRYVVVAAGDGSEAVFSLSELDRSLGRAGVLLAWMADGEPLPAFRLVVSTDHSRARHLSGLTTITVRDARLG